MGAPSRGQEMVHHAVDSVGVVARSRAVAEELFEFEFSCQYERKARPRACRRGCNWKQYKTNLIPRPVPDRDGFGVGLRARRVRGQ